LIVDVPPQTVNRGRIAGVRIDWKLKIDPRQKWVSTPKISTTVEIIVENETFAF